jgi:hypothetical protein
MDLVSGGAVMSAHLDAEAKHRFDIGCTVHLGKAFPLRNAVQGPYEVLGQLPRRDGEFQYRIKSSREPYQRIVKEGELEPASNSSQ